MEGTPHSSAWWWKGAWLLGVGVFIGLGYGVFLYLNPYDEVAVEVSDVSAGTEFLCLVADAPGGPVPMPWSLNKVVPFTMHPDGCTASLRSPSEAGPHRRAVNWVSGERVGVLLQDKMGVWRIAWFTAAESRIQGRSLLLGGGSWRASLRDAATTEPLKEPALRTLGLSDAITRLR